MHQEVAIFCAEREFAHDIEFRHLREGVAARDPQKIVQLMAHRRNRKKRDD